LGLLAVILCILLSLAVGGIALGITTILPSLVSVVGSTIVAWAVYRAGRTQDRIKTTLDLHKDYYSPAFAISRNMAEHFYQFHHYRDWAAVNPYDLDDPEDNLKGYSEVVRYFHRLSILWQRDRLDHDLVTDLFPRETGYWMGFVFEPMNARTDWWTKPDIYLLAEHLKRANAVNYSQGFQEGLDRRTTGPIRMLKPDGSVVKADRDGTASDALSDGLPASGARDVDRESLLVRLMGMLKRDVR
jgi:hypothetical protein